MIVFELTMPHCGSWNGKWSQADRLHIRTKIVIALPMTNLGVVGLWNKGDFKRSNVG